jgi:hypothetical protein
MQTKFLSDIGHMCEGSTKIDHEDTGCKGVDRIHLAWVMVQWVALVDMVLNLKFRKTQTISWLAE